MDQKVLRALLSLNLLYGNYLYLLGYAAKWKGEMRGYILRKALKNKVRALIEHDRKIEDRSPLTENEMVIL